MKVLRNYYRKWYRPDLQAIVVVGDIDVESFPTLAVFRAGQTLHYGVSLPQEGLVARMIDTLAARPPEAAGGMPEEVVALGRWIGGAGTRINRD